MIAYGKVLSHDSQRRAEEAAGEEVDLESMYSSVALDIIGEAVFNFKFLSVQSKSPVIDAVYNLMQEAEHRSFFLLPYWKVPASCLALVLSSSAAPCARLSLPRHGPAGGAAAAVRARHRADQRLPGRADQRSVADPVGGGHRDAAEARLRCCAPSSALARESLPAPFPRGHEGCRCDGEVERRGGEEEGVVERRGGEEEG
eukprot:665948-Hanusia_phi.AAC.3